MCGTSGDSKKRHEGREKEEGFISRIWPALPIHRQPHPDLPPTHPSRKTSLDRGLGQSPGSRGLSLSLCLAHTEARNES